MNAGQVVRRPTHAWCSSCKEDSAIDSRGRCLWCGGETTPSKPKRGGWKRPDVRGSHYTEEQLRALHVAHMRGAPLNSLAKQSYERVGYGSHGSAATAISREWKRLGLKARDRIEATVAVSTKHGRGRRNRDEQAYRRFLMKQRGWKAQRGPGQARCVGIKRQPPGAGEQCARPSVEGSDYCRSHEPSLELQRQAETARMRKRQAPKEMVPFEPFMLWLHSLRAELGTAKAVAEATGIGYTLVCRYLKGQSANGVPKKAIGRETAREAIENTGASVEDVYGREAIAT